MKPYSEDLRRKILAACEDGAMTHQEVAELLRVSVAFIQRLLRRWRATGQLAPQPPAGGFPAAIHGPVADRIARWVAEQPDLTLAELCARLRRHGGCRVSVSTMCRALQRLGCPGKKVALRLRARHPARPGPPPGVVAAGASARPAAAGLRR